MDAAPSGSIVIVPDARQPSVYHTLTAHNFPHKDFHPHGIALLQLAGRTLLYVVNHRRDGDAVEVFQLDADSRVLTYISSLTHPLFRNINDVAAASEGVLYVTNWIYYAPGTKLNMLETYLQQAWGYTVACTGQDCRVVVEHQKMPNGVVLNADKKTVIIVESTSKTVNVFDRDTETSALALKLTLPTETLCDNIELDAASGLVGYFYCPFPPSSNRIC